MTVNKIAVAGTGYVGLSLATLLAQHNKVVAVDMMAPFYSTRKAVNMFMEHNIKGNIIARWGGTCGKWEIN